MQIRDIIVIGASAGGVTALKALVSTLPQDQRFYLHCSACCSYSESRLPLILERRIEESSVGTVMGGRDPCL